MKVLLLIFSVFIFTNCFGQGVLKRLPKPNVLLRQQGSPVASISSVSLPLIPIHAWRLTGPIAGFMYPQNQLVTGLGYGYQRLHWIDSTQKYYTDFSVSGVIYFGGDVDRSNNNPYNIMSVGVSLGVLNQLIMVGPAYNLPKTGIKGTFGVVFNLSMPLNN